MGSDVGKAAGIATLGATGLGLAGIGPLAGMMGGASAAGTGAAGAAGTGLFGSPAAYTLGTGLTGTAAGPAQAAMLAEQTGVFGLPGLTATANAASLANPSVTPEMFSKGMMLGQLGTSVMNRGNQQRSPASPAPMLPIQSQPQQSFTGMSPYNLPGGMKLHSMNTAGMFRRPYG